MAKRYEELEFTDRFMFAKILYNYPALCRELLEFILEKKISRIEPVQYEKNVEISYASKGVRFDVYTEDDENNSYDIEMQVEIYDSIPKRSRYYHSIIDSAKLKKGDDYTELRKSFVIFICKNNPRFAVDAPIYMFKTMAENVPGVVLEDDRYTVFINAQYTGEDISDAMKEFLHFIRTGKVADPKKDDLTTRLFLATEDAKSHEGWRDDYMTLNDIIKEENEKVIKETEVRVRKETEAKVRSEEMEKGIQAINAIAEMFGISKEEAVEKYREIMNS